MINKPIGFIHIPKTAGTYLSQPLHIISIIIDSSEIIYCDDPECQCGAYQFENVEKLSK